MTTTGRLRAGHAVRRGSARQAAEAGWLPGHQGRRPGPQDLPGLGRAPRPVLQPGQVRYLQPAQPVVQRPGLDHRPRRRPPAHGRPGLLVRYL